MFTYVKKLFDHSSDIGANVLIPINGLSVHLTFIVMLGVCAISAAAQELESASVTEARSDDDDDVFSYLKSQDITSLSPAAVQLDDYLNSVSTAVECLTSYPHVMNAFIKANSTLLSSAAVERLFSAAGQILCSRRCKLSDKHFDMFVFLRDFLKNV